MRCAAARRAGWSGIDKYPGVAIAAPVDGHTVCTPPRILDTTNPSRRGAPSERGSLRYPASVPPSPRTTEPRFRECADKVHDLASLKVSHAPLANLRRSTTNPEFPKIQAPRKPVSCPRSDASSIPIVRFITAKPVSYTCPAKKTLRSYCHLLASTVIPKLFRVDGTRGAVPLTSRAIFGIRFGVVLE